MKKKAQSKTTNKPREKHLTVLALFIMAVGIIFAAEFTVFGIQEHKRVDDANLESRTLAETELQETEKSDKLRLVEVNNELLNLDAEIEKLEAEIASTSDKTAAGKAELERLEDEVTMFKAEKKTLEAEKTTLDNKTYEAEYEEESSQGYLCYYFAAVSSLVVSSLSALVLTMASRGYDKRCCK